MSDTNQTQTPSSPPTPAPAAKGAAARSAFWEPSARFKSAIAAKSVKPKSVAPSPINAEDDAEDFWDNVPV